MERKVYMNSEDFKRQNKLLSTNLPFEDDISILKSDISICGKKIANRLVCQAMEGCDADSDGGPGELTKRRYNRLAKGGARIIWFEATAVMEEGKANPHQLYINSNTLDSFKAIIEKIKETSLRENGFEPVVIMQATHSGRYSKPDGFPSPMIAYNNPILEAKNPILKECIVSDEYIDRVKEALINGARLAEKAGFDGVDIKCCHRYLNSELMSAFFRTGRYGGCLENRTRLLRESVCGAIESCKSDFIVSSRINIYDGFEYPYGFGVSEGGALTPDLSEAEWVVKKLYQYGVHLLNITMGNPYFNPHVNRPFAKGSYIAEEHPLEGVARMLSLTAELKKRVPEMALICSGLSYLGVCAPNVAAGYIGGGFDFAGFGRESFAYPDFAKDLVKNGSFDKNKCCICCSKCTEIMRSGGHTGCVIRDREVYGDIYQKCCGGKNL